ncbi:MAG: DUF1996 domain-containing protein [Actinobacteria bacterium]|nr:DUF1996 domain-containing protein [Actinomycetota bacterium]
MLRRSAGFIVAAAAVMVIVTGCGGGGSLAGPTSSSGTATESTPPPNRSLVSYGGQFLSSCGFSHTLADDPIVHRGHPGASHQHEFFGNVATDASSTYAGLIDAPSTCSDAGDRSAYWVPTLTIDGRRAEPRRVDAYYRAGPGVDATTVRAFPPGLEVLAGNQFSTRPESLLIAAWACGSSPQLAHEPPRDCTSDRPIQLRLTYPSCWDGKHVRSADHTSHMAYPNPGSGCDGAHPVALPQLTLVVHYASFGTYRQAHLASGGFDTSHGDFLAAWQPKRITDQVTGCLRRGVTCGIVGGTFHTGKGSGDENSYNLPPATSASTTLPVYDDGRTTTTMDAYQMAHMDN